LKGNKATTVPEGESPHNLLLFQCLSSLYKKLFTKSDTTGNVSKLTKWKERFPFVANRRGCIRDDT